MKRIMPCLLAVATIFALSFISCKADDNEDKGTGNSVPAVDYESANGSYLIMVTNNTTEKLVAFKSSPALTNLIGGIPANSHNHKLKLNDKLFPSTSDFVLFVLKEKDFINNYNNLAALANKPFTTLYAFYNASSSNARSYEISSHLGGEGSITITQPLGINMCVELRLGSPYGETLGFLYKGEPRATFRLPLNTGNNEDPWYDVFPVFRRYDKNKNKGEIISIFPTYVSGANKGKPLFKNFILEATEPDQTLDVSEWYNNVKFISGYAYIEVINNSDYVISFSNGTTTQMTSTGGVGMRSGSSQTFQFEMPNASASFDNASLDLKTLKINTTGTSIAVPERTVKTEYLYRIEVTGNSSTGLQVSDISVIGKYNFDKDEFSPVNSDSD